MKKLTKKMLAVLLSVVMAIPTLLVVPFSAEAVTEWTVVASSDFTQAPAVSNGSLGEVPTYEGQGSAMTWSTGCWTGNGEVEKSSDGALYVPDGYIYLSGYQGGAVPIAGSSNWRIELGFRFKDVKDNDIHVTDGYHADEEHCFIKMYNNTAALTNPTNASHDACYFEQNANGQCYAGDYTIGEGSNNPDNAVCTGSKNLTWDTNYKYIAEYSDGVLKAYIQDEDGAYVQFINETDDDDFINALKNTANVNSIKIGDDNDSAFFRSLEYNYIIFSTGVETGTVEDKMKEAIELYEVKMSGDIFAGMTEAYDAYVAANEAYDAWKYGNGVVTDEQLEAAAKNLRKKSVAMTQWSYNGINGVTPAFNYSTASSDLYAQYGVDNILYWGDYSSCDDNTTSEVQIQLYYPTNTVLLLDGKGTPAMPVLIIARRTGNNKRYFYQFYPCASNGDSADNANFTLIGAKNNTTGWIGISNNSHQSEIGWTGTVNNGWACAKSSSGDPSTSFRLEMTENWGRKWASLANVLKFKGTMSDYSHTYTLCWYGNTGNNPGDIRYMDATGRNIHVINYKALLDVMQSPANLNTINIGEAEYTQGGLRSILEAYDLATAVDPTAYDYSNTDNVAVVGTAIGNAVAAFNDAATTKDVAGYDALRKAIGSKQITYDGGEEGYTEESWAAFAEAFEAAQDIFTNIQTTGYDDAANAKAKADALNAVELVTKVDKVDSTNLEIAINEATDAIENKSMFTTASYAASNIETVVATAKSAVWGAVENYPNAKHKLDLSDDNTAIVEGQYDAVKAAIFALKIDKDTTVASASEQSMNSAIAAAANYSSEDYGNYADLASAVNAASSFAVSVNTITEGCVFAKISEYKTKVRAIVNAINLLRPAFDKITNGTWGSFTANDSTRIDSTEGESRWRLNFVRNNDVVVFRTQYEAFTVDLGGAQLEWYDKESNYAAELDSINVYDESEDNTVGEITSSSSAAGFNPSAVSIDDAQNTYPGMLSASTEENSTYTLKNITCTAYTDSSIGKDLTGEGITDMSTILDEILSSTQGSSTSSLTGTVTAKNGTTYMTADYTVSIPREAKKTLSATTLPALTEHTLSSNFGMIYYWKYQPFLRYIGYSHNRTPYTQTTYVMNIAPLMELITRARALEGDEQLYQKSAWNTFSAALSAARADMDYGNMTASAIESACQTRYTNLWNAYTDLLASPAATNSSIKAAVEDETIGDTYKADNKDGSWSAARWATFKEAYEAAAGVIAVGAKYSDANVRDYGTSEQNAIDAYAAAVTAAYSDLTTYGPRADFTALDNAASRTGYEALEADKYTVTSLNAIAAALADGAEFPYLNMTAEERNAVYSETAEIEAIAAEVTKVNNLYASTPVVATVDAAALEAAQATAKASINDPDAYGNIDEIKALIDKTTINEEVTIYGGYAVSGIRYDTQEELNADVTALLEGLTAKDYTVSVVDENGDALDVDFADMDGNALADNNGVLTVAYGTRIRVYAPGEDAVDWFYSYSSNTVSQTASKYYTTDKWINLTVKGDTTLMVKSAAEQTETVKITYVNALTGKTFAVDYTAKNEAYELQAAPALAYYNFLGYSLEVDSEDYQTAITPSTDTVVFANYEFDEDNNDYFTVTIANMNGSITGTKLISDELAYNDLVELRLGDGSASEETGGIYRSTNAAGIYWINGEKQTFSSRGRYRNSEIYAWVIVKEDDIDTWESYRENPGVNISDLAGIEHVVQFGDSYSFRVCENIIVIPYTEEQFNNAIDDENGFIKKGDENNASVYANNELLKVNNDDNRTQKVSMIGNFTLPVGDYELVEAGMLFKATTDGTTPEGDLTLANVGTNGIARMKSSQHTAGNQYVISVNTSKLATGKTITAKYCAYMIYTDGTNQHVVYSDAVTDSAVID